MKKLLIAAVDPGTTMGLALVDLKGNIVFLTSIKNAGVSKATELLMNHGKIIMVATDKANPPDAVKKIAASFGASIWRPEKDMQMKTKIKLLSDTNIKFNDAHERDAAAAAIAAYHTLAGSIKNIETTMRSLGLERYSETVRDLILTKSAKNIAEAIEIAMTDKSENIISDIKPLQYAAAQIREQITLMKEIDKLKRENESMRTYITVLEKRCSELEKQKARLVEEERMKMEKERHKVLREREIRARDILIKQLIAELKKKKELLQRFERQEDIQREIKDIEERGDIPIVRVKNFSTEALLEIKEQYGIKDRVLFFENFEPSFSAEKYISKLMPRAIIIPEEYKMETLSRKGIAVLHGLVPTLNKNVYFIPGAVFEKAVKEQRKKGFMAWLEDYRKR